MHLDHLTTRLNTRSIQALDKLLQDIDISILRKNLRAMTGLLLISEQSVWIEDHLEFVLDMKRLFEFLEVLENEDSRTIE